MSRIIGEALPNIPWEENPGKDVVWRYSQNPVIKRNAVSCANSIFNSAVTPFNGEFRGVFRIDDKTRKQRLHSGQSQDGINWTISEEPIKFLCEDKEIGVFDYGYDPRVCKIGDKYIVTWCNGYHGPTIGVAYTYDFETYHQLENAFLPCNRNGVMFPKKIHGNYAMLSRPSDNGHTPFGEIFYSESPDLKFWGNHRHVMAPKNNWEQTKIGAGPIPIETDEGWLLFYHGVLTSCNGFVYSFGAALLDREEPWKALYRSDEYLISPQTDYECVGDVPNVAFPCSCLADAQSGRIAIYYGCADTVTGLAFTTVDEVIRFLKK